MAAPDVPLHRYLALLRAVNVGRRQVRMAALRAWVEGAGFSGVETHIQSGNLKVETPTASGDEVRAALEALLHERTGFEVPCIMVAPEELRRVVEDADGLEPPPFTSSAELRRYVVFLPDPPPAADAAALAAWDATEERAVVRGRAVHLWIAGGLHEAKVPVRFARVLGPGTNRNLTVVRTLAQKWGA